MTEPFRDGVADTRPEDIRSKIEVYVYELNLLMRLAATHDIAFAVDIVDREHYTEVVVRDIG